MLSTILGNTGPNANKKENDSLKEDIKSIKNMLQDLKKDEDEDDGFDIKGNLTGALGKIGAIGNIGGGGDKKARKSFFSKKKK